MGFYDKAVTKFVSWLTKEPPPSETPPYDFNRLKYELRPCDVLLIEGQSRVSNYVRAFTQSPWTHAAIYVGRLHDIEDNYLRKILATHMDKRENTRLVIEGLLGKGTVVTPLSAYRHQHIRICRPIGLSPTDAEEVIAFAIKSLGKPYNVRQLLDMARFLLPWSILPRRYRSSLFNTPSGEPESGICSSMIAEAFNNVHFPILPVMKKSDPDIEDDEENIELVKRHPHLYTPKDFDYSPYFEIIKYPFFNPEQQTPYYRRLPWTREGILSHDDGIIKDHYETTEPKENNKTFLSKLLRHKHEKNAKKTSATDKDITKHEPDRDDS